MRNSGNIEIRGFSLVEVAIVVTIIGISLGAGMTVVSEYSKLSKITQTKIRIQEIMDAINDYADKHGYLPCPADATIKFGNPNYGVGGGTNSATCSSANLRGGGTADSPTVIGMVPTRELNLYPTAALDGWGRRITYMVRENIVNTTGLLATNINLDLRNFEGTSTYSDVAVVVLSHGANGYGAYLGRGGSTRISPNAGIDQEDRNNEVTDHFHASVSVAGFDDILSFWTKGQIIDENME